MFFTQWTVAAHEIGHAMGVLHEQSRPDRNDYVTVNFNNIISGTENNFYFYDESIVACGMTPYDIGSVMHYSSTVSSYHFRLNKYML